MKPFDLEAAKAGAKICMINGDAAIFIGMHPIHFQPVVEDVAAGRITYFHPDRLRMAPTRRTVWVNLSSYHEKTELGSTAWHYPTEDSAKADARRFYATSWIAIAVPGEIEE
jgi:hypothetical protein